MDALLRWRDAAWGTGVLLPVHDEILAMVPATDGPADTTALPECCVAPQGVIVARVFINYATPDRAVADEVEGWLHAAGHRTFLAHHPCDGIGIGEDWKRRLYASCVRPTR